jgi:PAS domain S-box-containing protein
MSTSSELPLSAEEILSLLENKCLFGTWRSQLGSNDLVWSPGLFKILGVNPAQLQPSFENYTDLVHPEDQHGFPRSSRVFTEDLLRYREFRIIRPDGALRWLSSEGQILFARDGTPAHVLGIVKDITLQIGMRQELKTQSAIADILADLFEASVWDAWPEDTLADPQPRLRNGHSHRLTGALRRAHRLDEIHPDDRNRVINLWAHAIGTRQRFAADYRVSDKDGSFAWVHSRAVPRLEPSGGIQAWVGASRLAAPFGDDRAPAESPRNHQISAAQIRAARGFLGWSANDLADRAGLSLSTIRRVEIPGERIVREDGLTAIRMAFEEVGISFVADLQGRIGVLLR